MGSDAWMSFNSVSAKDYLSSVESREQRARNKVIKIISEISSGRQCGVTGDNSTVRVLELGPGNGERLELALSLGLSVAWTGIDISSALIGVARQNSPNHTWLIGDAEYPEQTLGDSTTSFDVCLFCHVIETLESPELALQKARRLAKYTVIEFFEPPTDEAHRSEIRTLAESGQPYIRHKIGTETYLTWLRSAGFENLVIHRTFGKYEVHVLS